ncbi:MAG: hypothetical protein KDC60_02885 [Bacteroidetes bacterium]|nr:hypothetical protein [Bacteroidota bacterium]MCB0513356.1 hypothetical protein [Bacteroidota bacterium]MCB9074603.1 hypothetical protein [Chitinophagales bacterium]
MLVVKKGGWIERYGSGVLRIQNICEDYGVVEPVFEELTNGFRVIIYSGKQNVTDVGLNEGLKSLLEIISLNKGILAKDAAILLENRPIKTIERQIAQLIEKGLIERRGSRKTGGYFIKNNDTRQ